MKSWMMSLIFLSTVLLASCSNSYHQQYARPAGLGQHQRLVAVLPLVNLTAHPNAGRIVGDILTTELYSLSTFKFMERTEMLEKIRGTEEDLEYVMDTAVAMKIGTKLGVDTLIFGSVGEYQYKRGIDQSPAVGINLRMLDVTTGDVVWAASMSRTGGCFFVCDDSLSRLTQKTCNEMVAAMLEAIDQRGK